MERIIKEEILGDSVGLILTADNIGDNQTIHTIIDFSEIAASLKKPWEYNQKCFFLLEYLQMDYYLPSKTSLPIPPIDDTDSDAGIQGQIREWQRKHTPARGYSVQWRIWRKINNGDWQIKAQDLIYNYDGQTYLPLITPYLVPDEVDLCSEDKKYGFSIQEGELGAGDRILLWGSYRGWRNYDRLPPPIEGIREYAGGKTVGQNPEIIMFGRDYRTELYLGNAGEGRLYFRFSDTLSSLDPGASPFLEPGESLSYSNGKLEYSGGGNQHLVLTNQHAPQQLRLIVVSDTITKAVWQEFFIDF